MVRALLAPETFNLGETTRAVEVALAMRALGHDVLVAGYSRRFSDVVTGAGLPLTLLDPELSDADADLLLAADQGRALRHPFTTDMVRERVAAETALLRDWRAGVAVIGTTLTQFISARAARVPLAYVKPHAMSSGHLSTLESLPLTAGRGPAGRTVNRAAASMARGVAGKVRWLPTSFRLVAAEYGVRLPARARENLFRAFQGGARKGGSGLGLTIAAELIRGHGGRLDLLRSDSEGTEFLIQLPRSGGLDEDAAPTAAQA